MRRAFLLSLDAFVAVGFLLVLATVISGMSVAYSHPEVEYQRLYYSGKDMMNILETARLSAAISLMPENYSEACNISAADLNKTILDSLGYLWAQNSSTMKECAENLTREILNATLPESLGCEVLIDGVSIYERGTEGNVVSRLHTIVSGYELGMPVSGYFASAYVSRMSKRTSSYVYFGGYEGDGNITKKLTLPDDANISLVYMELSPGGNFTLLVNGGNEGEYLTSGMNMTAENWTVCSGLVDCANFTGGENVLELFFKGTGKNYIGGGFVRANYNTSEPDTLPFSTSNTTTSGSYAFPGIDGVANLYSSFHIPGDVESMTISLHYESNCTTNCTLFLNLGNVTVYESNDSGEISALITNASLYTLLENFTLADRKTIPLRLGLRDMEHVEGGEGAGDSVLVTDVSGSMEDCGDYSGNRTCTYDYCVWWSGFFETCIWWENIKCDNPGTCSADECGTGETHFRNHDTCDTKLQLAQDGNKDFIDVVLNFSGNRVGLVNYSSSTRDVFSLTQDNASLKDAVGTYHASGSTCICCGIINATDLLADESNSSRRRSMVVMSDGQATTRCYNADEDKDGDFDVDEFDDTIQAACDAYEDYGITVYTIGYGSGSDNTTMNLTAQCGGGNFYYSSTDSLAETYRQIAEDIAITYFAQTVKVDYDGTYGTKLFPDSVIEFNYTPDDFLRYGEVSIAMQSERFGGNVSSPKEGSFTIPQGSRILDAAVTSYSSEFWTSSLLVNSSATSGWEKAYNISDYTTEKGEADEFVDIGDPFSVYIPGEMLAAGKENLVSLDTAFTSSDTTGGSPDGRAVYHVGVSGIVGYGEMFNRLENATEDATGRLQKQLSGFNITMLEIETPYHYVSELPSLWGPSVMEVRVWS